MENPLVVADPPDDPFAVMTRDPLALNAVATERLEAELCSLAAHIDAALCRFLMMVAEYDRRQGWQEWEARSCAHWLSWKCGISLGTAREHVRVGHALETLPRLRAALAAGRLSYSKVRAITRVAEPAIEQALIEVAEGSTAAGLERICRAYRRHGEAAEPDAAVRAHAARSFTWHYDDDGSLVIAGRVTAEHAPTVLAMLDAGRDALDEPDTPEHVPAGTSPARREPLAARNADAFVLAAEAFLAHGAAPVGQGVELTVIVDEAALRGDPSGVCHIDDGPALHSHVARRLACDCGAVAAVIGQDGDPLYASRHSYIVNRRLRRALHLRDGRCQFPGCDHKARLQAHHITHWIDGGPTILVNLVLLCAKHHRAVHEGGFTLTRADDHTLHVRRPDGTILTCHQPTTDTTRTLEDHHHEAGIDINARTNDCRWEGRTANISDIISYFDTTLEHERRHRHN